MLDPTSTYDFDLAVFQQLHEPVFDALCDSWVGPKTMEKGSFAPGELLVLIPELVDDIYENCFDLLEVVIFKGFNPTWVQM